MVKVSTTERRVLEAMVECGADNYLGFGYMSFDHIASSSGVDRKKIRRVVRALARKGLAEFAKGLWDDEGMPAGAGYAATKLGSQFINQPKESVNG